MASNEVKGWYRKTCTAPGRLDDKLAIVTGASAGIGEVTASELARRGCTVILACRDMGRGQAAIDRILDRFGPSKPENVKIDVADQSIVQYLSVVQPSQLLLESLDLASLQSVRQFADRISSTHSKLDYLINNAGVIHDNRTESADGFELTMATNHLGPFLLTELLLPLLKRGAPSRVLLVSSRVHYTGKLWKPDLFVPARVYTAYKAYGSSKLANVMYARTLSHRLEGTGVIAVSLHPGTVKTEIRRHLSKFGTLFVQHLRGPRRITPWQGAQTTLYAVLTKNLVPGGYYSNCALKTPADAALNDEDCNWLWTKSCELVGIASTE